VLVVPRHAVTKAAVKQIAVRSTKASAKLENRTVPARLRPVSRRKAISG
jgi:hypothetical protein